MPYQSIINFPPRYAEKKSEKTPTSTHSLFSTFICATCVDKIMNIQLVLVHCGMLQNMQQDCLSNR